ncbi:MAG TPA: hypothetical protein VF701_02920 [Thermoanaerobaculia bacterium]
MAVRRLLPVMLSLLLLASSACSRDTVNRAQWEGMTRDNQILYVKSLIGAEKVREAKGGTGRTYDRSAEDYVAEIDREYARGDERPVHLIFEGLEPQP